MNFEVQFEAIPVTAEIMQQVGVGGGRSLETDVGRHALAFLPLAFTCTIGNITDKKVGKKSGVNAMWSIDDMQDYVEDFAADRYAEMVDLERFVPYEIIADFVNTLRIAACNPKRYIFGPLGKLSFQRATGAIANTH